MYQFMYGRSNQPKRRETAPERAARLRRQLEREAVFGLDKPRRLW